MPTLDFKGKTAVQYHHLAVPHHQLVPEKGKSLTDTVSLHDNLIVQGDNLLALKALLPTYAGKVKCIYIDPPYNTGNEGWVYNDKVNSPIIKDWIGQTVGKEGEDLTRHDKWLCMMLPRLKLLRELLADDGVIFVSIDDNEQHNLREIMDEVFQAEHRISTIIRQTIKGGTGPSDAIRQTHDYVIAYAKNSTNADLIGLPNTEIELNLTDEKGSYARGRELNKWGAGSRREDSPSMWYPLSGPNGEDVYPIRNDGSEGRWRWGKQKLTAAAKDGDVIFEPRGDGTYIVYEKVRASSDRRKSQQTLFLDEYLNAHGTEEMKAIFDGRSPFDYPKPVSLVKVLSRLANANSDDIILDSFAGSGTTAQAVLELNKEDGGNRRFILVEMEGYADSITAERVRRVVKGVPTAKNPLVRAGLGGTFSYFSLGDAIELKTLLDKNQLPTWLEMAKYIYYTGTGNEFDDSAIDQAKNYIGHSKDDEVYMYYKPNMQWLKEYKFTLEEAKLLRVSAGTTKRLLVYAPAKYVDNRTLDELNIGFCQLPYEIYELAR